MGTMVYRPYPRRLECLTFANVINKAALYPQLFKDLGVGPAGVFDPVISRTVVRCATN